MASTIMLIFEKLFLNVVINVVYGFTKNVTSLQKTLAMVCVLFANLAKTMQIFLMTISGISSLSQMITFRMIRLCHVKNKLTPILTNLATLITGKFSIKEAYTLST